MDREVEQIEDILKKIFQITKESRKYWEGKAGDYHRAYLSQWCKDSMEQITTIKD